MICDPPCAKPVECRGTFFSCNDSQIENPEILAIARIEGKSYRLEVGVRFWIYHFYS